MYYSLLNKSLKVYILFDNGIFSVRSLIIFTNCISRKILFLILFFAPVT